MAKKNKTEASHIAAVNLSAFFEEQQNLKEGFSISIPDESPHLRFLEPLWGKTPRYVRGQHEEFIIGEIIDPLETDEQLDNTSREGIWNAATGELVFKRMGAVSLCWNPDFSQIGVWYEYLDPKVSKPNVRSDYLWKFERYSFETKKIISSCNIKSDGYLWSVYVDFPKKYKGAIARFYGSSEDGGESIYILCDDQNGDHELSSEEIQPLRKSKSFDLQTFWDDIRNPKSLATEPVLPEVTGERKEALVAEVERCFNYNSYQAFTYEEITRGFKGLTGLIDMIAVNDWQMPKIAHNLKPQWIFTWKNPNKKGLTVRVTCKSTKTILELISQSIGEHTLEEFNESNLRIMLETLDNPEV